jgi:hypothetical protein
MPLKACQKEHRHEALIPCFSYKFILKVLIDIQALQ